MQLLRSPLNTPVINVMLTAVTKAARGLNRDFMEIERLQVSKKGPGDFVTKADLMAEKRLREYLEEARPRFGFLMEESGEVRGEDPTHRWIIDPIDGTLNFLHGLPHFAITLALEHEGKAIAGVTYNPATDELFVAERGKGAFFNDSRMRVSGRKDMGDALVGLAGPLPREPEEKKEFDALRNKLESRVAALRVSGSAALDLAYTAAGRLDAFVGLNLKPWDVAAGLLMIQEAGGYIHEQGPRVMAANDQLHGTLKPLVV